MTSVADLYKIYLDHSVICTDSRSVEKGSLFFALQGDNFDGNQYAEQAIANGSAYAVVDDPAMGELEGCIAVESVEKALQSLAAHHRDQLSIPILCITGTNGKTTTKELIAAVLSKKFNTVATKGNLNNHLGVPISLLGISVEAEIAVIELGANHIGEIEFLCDIAKPTHGIITNIGKAHLEGFGSLEGVIQTKTELYKFIKGSGGIAFVNADNELLMTKSSDLNKETYGSADADCVGVLEEASHHLQVSFEVEAGKGKVNSQLIGAYNFENILAAICIGSHFGVEGADISSAVAGYVPDNSRSQEIDTANNHVIMDAYNANPMNVKAALDNFSQQFSSNRMVILGDMLELGEYAEEEHKAVVEQLISQGHDRVILVGQQFSAAFGTLRCEYFQNTEDAAAWLETSPANGMNILIKGSRGIGLEGLLDKL